MIDHDPQCPLRYRREPTETCIECAHIARVRADERERIAAAIEVRRDVWTNDWPGLAEAGAMVNAGTVRITYDECAEVARHALRAGSAE